MVSLLFEESDLGTLDGFSGEQALNEPGVKEIHELRGGFVTDTPEAHEEGSGSGVEKTSNESKEFVAQSHFVQACLASAESDEVAVQTQAVDRMHVEWTVGKAEKGQHRVVRSERAMGREVKDSALGPSLRRASCVAAFPLSTRARERGS